MMRNSEDTAPSSDLDEDSGMVDSEIPVSDGQLPPEVLAVDNVESNDAIEQALHQFVIALKQEFARERERERSKIRQSFTDHVRKLEVEARQVVRKRVAEARSRDQKKFAAREQRVNELFRKVNLLARDIVHQKRMLKKSRDEFDRKLMESDYIQTELRNIGHQMGEQVDSLGNSLLNESFIEESVPEADVKYG